MDELLTRKEAAERLRISVSTLDRWRSEGIIKEIVIRRCVRIPASEIRRIAGRACQNPRAGRNTQTAGIVMEGPAWW